MSGAAAVEATPDQMLEFTLGTERYCVCIELVDEIVSKGEITPLPDTQPAIAGVMDLRGEMATLVKPAVLFDIDTDEDGQQVIIFDSDDERYGWIVDKVHNVSEIADPDLDPVDDNEFVNGLVSDGETFTIWVDAATIHGSLAI
jgi:purine-binding chemotaxis protein CheW